MGFTANRDADARKTGPQTACSTHDRSRCHEKHCHEEHTIRGRCTSALQYGLHKDLNEVTQSISTCVWRKFLCSELSRSLRRETLALCCSMAVRSQQAGCRPLDPWAGLTRAKLKKRIYTIDAKEGVQERSAAESTRKSHVEEPMARSVRCLGSMFRIVQHTAEMVPKSERIGAAQLIPVLRPTTSRRRHPKPDVPGVATSKVPLLAPND